MIRPLLALAALVALAMPAVAEPVVPKTASGHYAYIPPLDGPVTLRPVPQDRIDYIWRWVADYAGFDADEHRPPMIHYLSRHMLQRSAFGERDYWRLRAQIEEDHAARGYSVMMMADNHGAAYRKGTMLLPIETDWTSGDWDFIVAHEFIHHWQWLRGDWDKYECRAKLEPEAYAAQNAWSEQYGGEIVNDAHIGQVLMACMWTR